MGVNIKSETFTVKVKGELTEEEFFGTFKAMPILPHGLQMERDRLRREYLGPAHPDHATLRAKNQAEVFSELHVSIIESPKWWSESNNGLALYDDAVVAAVHAELNKVQNKFITDLKKRQDDAKKDLAKVEAPESVPGQ